jgi:hypothetical protein
MTADHVRGPEEAVARIKRDIDIVHRAGYEVPAP